MKKHDLLGEFLILRLFWSLDHRQYHSIEHTAKRTADYQCNNRIDLEFPYKQQGNTEEQQAVKAGDLDFCYGKT